MDEQDVPVIVVSDEYTIYATEQAMLPATEKDCLICRGQGCPECHHTGLICCWEFNHEGQIQWRGKKKNG